jgi:hypothetical protein
MPSATARQVVDGIIKRDEGDEDTRQAPAVGAKAVEMADADAQHQHSAEHGGEGKDRPELCRRHIGDEEFEDGGERGDGIGAGKPAGGNAVAAPGGYRQEKHAETLRDEKVHRQQEARATHWPPYAR